MRWLFGLLVAVVLAASPAIAQDKPLRGVALVIGQSNYAQLPKLANPANDATAMAYLLGRLGFEVKSARDGDLARLTAEVKAFETAAADADVALVYYSGHGIEAGGENYLVPIDADLTTPAKAGATLMPVSAILDDLAKTVPVTIVLLDACRSDAFPPGTLIQPQGTSETLPVQQAGLGELRGPAPIAKPGVPADNLGMVIGFAASPGQPALDGAPGEPNSPYATALLKHLGAGGYSFGDVMTLVTEEVYLKTKAKQLPWVNSSLRRILSFGTPIIEGDVDETAIKQGRRSLLLDIAGSPDSSRNLVETVAAQEGVPMDALFGMLEALGVDTSDPSQLQAQLADAALRLKKMQQEPVTAIDLDAEAVRLASLADEAETEGAFRQTLDLRERAVEAGRKAATADPQKIQLAALLAKAGDASWLLFDLDKAAAHFAEAHGLVAGIDEALATHYLKLQADALAAIGEYKGDNDAFDQALALYDEALTYYDGQRDDDIWADTANDYASALAKYGMRRADDEYLIDSTTAYGQVLDIWTRETKPVDWARAKNNIGNSYAALGDRNQDSDKWNRAAAAYRDALEEWSRDKVPLEWARANNNLGTVLHTVGNYEKDEAKLKNSIESYELALKEWTRKRTPYDWALVHNNLGNALTDLAKVQKNESGYQEGIDAYLAALEEWPRDKVPLDWATVQNNLGATYASLGRLQKGKTATATFHQAVDAYNSCLEERTRDRDPRNWALTNYNLGLVLTDLAKTEDDTAALEQAVAAFNASLEVYDRDDSTVDWADAQDGLGWVLAQLGHRTKDATLITQGKEAMQAALEIYADYDGAAPYFEDRLAQIDKWLKAVS
ncbi:MAG: caspase family protein [Devosia sp.]